MNGLARTETDAPMSEAKAKRPTMFPREPEEWPHSFVRYLNSGDLEALVALYAPNARFAVRSGKRPWAATAFVTC